ncbi:hypothetical protein KKG46_04650 [Patescibacteria group bacterium]|nr:hypothetical protein [Patescibacteria group bacterium]
MIETFKERATLFIVLILLVVLIIPTIVLAQSDLAKNYMMGMAGVKDLPKTAQTGAWHWQDVSENVGMRDGRAIWAVAKAGGYWYFTDGINFNEHGKVMRTDGQSYEDITLYVQQQGLERVDDIVSDGEGVMFLQDIVKRDGSYKVVSFDGITYEDATELLKEAIGEGQGFVSLQGKDGFWIAVTNNGEIRAFGETKFNFIEGLTQEQQVGLILQASILAGAVQSEIASFEELRTQIDEEDMQALELAELMLSVNLTTKYSDQMKYAMRHVSVADGYNYLPVSVVLMDDAYLVAVKDAYKDKYADETRFFMFGRGMFFEDVTDKIGQIKYLHAMATDGKSVIIAGSDSELENSDTNRVFLFDGQNQAMDLTTQAMELPFANWNRASIASNGSSWMVLSGKSLIRFDGKDFEDLGETRDYFINVTGASNGMFYLGGLVSSKGMMEPAKPWKSKLVLVKEEGYAPLPPSSQLEVHEPVVVQDDQNMVTNTEVANFSANVKWPALKTSILKKGKTQTIEITAGSPEGLKKIDIFANNNIIKTCEFESQNSEQSCSFQFSGDDYPDMSFIKIMGIATNENDQQAYSDGVYFVVVDASTFSSNYVLGAGILGSSADGIVSPGAKVTYKVDATIDNGLKAIEIFVNGQSNKVCDFTDTNTGVCETEITAGLVPGGSISMITKFMSIDDQSIYGGARVLEVRQ